MIYYDMDTKALLINTLVCSYIHFQLQASHIFYIKNVYYCHKSIYISYYPLSICNEYIYLSVLFMHRNYRLA